MCCYFLGYEQLSMKNLPIILQMSHDTRSKWYFIGMMLKLDITELDSIRYSHRDTERCFLEMIALWLTVSKTRNWISLEEIFLSEIIDRPDTACKLIFPQ